jgi:DNA-binding PadR family transcriptional regulator
MECCKPKGYLTYLILWILSKKSMKGAEISKELEKRRGKKPSSGTLYPPLNELKNKELISVDEKKYYSLTPKGKKELKESCEFFCNIFYDVEEMLKFGKDLKTSD